MKTTLDQHFKSTFKIGDKPSDLIGFSFKENKVYEINNPYLVKAFIPPKKYMALDLDHLFESVLPNLIKANYYNTYKDLEEYTYLYRWIGLKQHAHTKTEKTS